MSAKNETRREKEVGLALLRLLVGVTFEAYGINRDAYKLVRLKIEEMGQG